MEAMITLAELVGGPCGTILRVVTAASDLRVPVARLVVVDPSDLLEVGRGDLVVGVGVAPGPAADRLLSQLAAGGAAGLVTSDAVAPRLAGEAKRLGLTLLSLPAGAQWMQAILLISAVVSHEGLSSAGDRLPAAGAGDLFAIADVVAELIDAPLTIEDPQSRVIAFSKRQEESDEARRLTILGRRVPDRYQDALRAAGVFQRLARASGPIYVEGVAEGLSPRVAIALRAGGALLGSIWATVPGPLSVEREASLVEASRFVALHLLRRSLIDDGGRLEGELLGAVLEGGQPAPEAARRLRLTGPAFVVVAVEPAADQELADGLLPRLRDLLSMHVSTDRRVPATVIGSTAYSVVTLPAASAGIGDALRRALERLAERCRSAFGVQAVIGVGSIEPSIAAVPASRARAQEVIRVLRAEARTGVAEIGDLWSKVLVRRVLDSLADDPDLLSAPVRSLQRHDRENNSGLLPTLTAYMRAFCSVERTAQELNVHPNTVRYRLRQIQQLTGLELTDPDERLALAIQLRLLADVPRRARSTGEPSQRQPPPDRSWARPPRAGRVGARQLYRVAM